MAIISLWEKETFYAPQDVIIAGAGLMGLWTAIELKKLQPQLSITILEKGITPMGASTRNAGFACFGSPTELLYDTEHMGVDAMLQLVEMRCKGIEKIRQHFNDNQIGFDNCGGYECLNSNFKINDLREKIVYLNSLLFPIIKQQNTFSIATDKLKTFGLQGFDVLIENKTEAALHSGKLVKVLTQKAQSLGVQILYGVEIKSWQNEGNKITIGTAQQIDFSANKLLFCTNAFTKQLFQQLKTEPARGQIIVTAPIENLQLKGTFHFDEGFYYWRNMGNRILLGGARNVAIDAEKTTNFSGSDIIQSTLENFLYTHILQQKVTIDYRWSGIMGFTEDKKPLLKAFGSNVFAAVSCNGMGVALTPVLAEEFAKMVLVNF